MPGYHAVEICAETLAIEKEIRDFLNSFDWKNASDYEKAVHVARRVNKAEYDNTTNSCSLAYGCLVEGKAVCDGFVNAACLLGKTGLTCYCETLYRKDNGEYWLHIVGGAMTSLARPTGINNLTGGEKIVSLTREEARQWCEHNLDAETYISIWGTPEE